MSTPELNAFCGACRVLYVWHTRPSREHAGCKRCGLPLTRAGQPRSLGVHDTVNERPRDLSQQAVGS